MTENSTIIVARRANAAVIRLNRPEAANGITFTMASELAQGTVVADGFGLGLAVPAVSGTPYLALSIAEHASVVTESLIADWKNVLLQELKAGVQFGSLQERDTPLHVG